VQDNSGTMPSIKKAFSSAMKAKGGGRKKKEGSASASRGSRSKAGSACSSRGDNQSSMADEDVDIDSLASTTFPSSKNGGHHATPQSPLHPAPTIPQHQQRLKGGGAVHSAMKTGHNKPPRQIYATPIQHPQQQSLLAEDPSLPESFDYNHHYAEHSHNPQARIGAVPINYSTPMADHNYRPRLHATAVHGEVGATGRNLHQDDHQNHGTMEMFRLQMEMAELKQRLHLLDDKERSTGDSDDGNMDGGEGGAGSGGETRSELLDLIKERDDEIIELNTTIATLQGKFGEIHENLEVLGQERQTLRDSVAMLEKENKRLSRHLNIREQEVVTLVKRLAGEDERISEAVEMNRQNASLQQELRELRHRLEQTRTIDASLQQLQQELDSERTIHQELQHRMDDMTKAHAQQLAQQEEDLRQQTAEHNTNIQSLQSKLSDRDSLIQTLQTSVKQMEVDHMQTTEQHQKQLTHKDTILIASQESSAALEELKRELELTSVELHDKSEVVRQLDHQSAEQSTCIDELRARHVELSAKHEDEVSLLQAHNSALEEQCQKLVQKESQWQNKLTVAERTATEQESETKQSEKKVAQFQMQLDDKDLAMESFERHHMSKLSALEEQYEQARQSWQIKHETAQREMESEVCSMRSKIVLKDAAIDALEEKTLGQTHKLLKLQSQLEEVTLDGRQELIGLRRFQETLLREKETSNEQLEALHAKHATVQNDMTQQIASLTDQLEMVQQQHAAEITSLKADKEGYSQVHDRKLKNLQQELGRAHEERTLTSHQLEATHLKVKILKEETDAQRQEIDTLKATADQTTRALQQRVDEFSDRVASLEDNKKQLISRHKKEMERLCGDSNKIRKEELRKFHDENEKVAAELQSASQKLTVANDSINILTLDMERVRKASADKMVALEKRLEEITLLNEQAKANSGGVARELNALRQTHKHDMELVRKASADKTCAVEKRLEEITRSHEQEKANSGGMAREMDAAKETMAKLQDKMSDLSQAHKQELTDLQSKVDERVDCLGKRIAKYSQDTASLQDEKARLEQSLAASGKAHARLSVECDNYARIFKSLETELKSLRDDMASSSKSLEQEQTSNKQEVDLMQLEVSALEEERDELKKQLQSFEQQKENIVSRHSKELARIHTSTKNVETELGDVLEQRDQQLKQVNTELDLLRAQLIGTEKENASHYSLIQDLQTQVKSLAGDKSRATQSLDKQMKLLSHKNEKLVQELQAKHESMQEKGALLDKERGQTRQLNDKLEASAQMIREMEDAEVASKQAAAAHLKVHLSDLREEHEEQYSTLRAQKESVDQKFNDLQTKLTLLRQESDVGRIDLLDQIDASKETMQALKEVLATKERALESLNGDLARDRIAHKEQMFTNRGKLDRAVKERRKWEEVASKNQNENKALRTKVEDTSMQLRAIKEKMQQHEIDSAEIVSELEDKIDDWTTKCSAMSKDLNDRHAKYESFAKDMEGKLQFALAEKASIEVELEEKLAELHQMHSAALAALNQEHEDTVTRLGNEARKWRSRASDPSSLAQKHDLDGLKSLLDERTRVLRDVMEQNESTAKDLEEAQALVVDLQEQSEEYLRNKECAEAEFEESERKRIELEDTMNRALHAELLIRGEVQAELDAIRQNLATQRKDGKDFISLEKENFSLKDKIGRQEQYMKRKNKQERVLRERLGNMGAKAPLQSMASWDDE
jgi:chromosome segregation ATPase